MHVYKPAPSYGWAWLIASSLIMFLVGLPALLAGAPGALIALIFVWPFGIAGLVLAYWFPSMRYELGPEELVLRYGPFRYPIPLKAIQTISKRNLAISLWSSVRFPGFALWTVPYADAGNVFMCATRSLTDILYIVTPTKKYGITPADEDAFLNDLQARLKG